MRSRGAFSAQPKLEEFSGGSSGREGATRSGSAGEPKVTIPRHREINEITAQGIFTTLEAELGLGWWKP